MTAEELDAETARTMAAEDLRRLTDSTARRPVDEYTITRPGETTRSGHSIEWTLDDKSITGKARCHEPEGADCRVQGSGGCECEQWAIERDPDGRPFHMVDDWDEEKDEQIQVRHEMMPTAYCNVVEWLDQMDRYDLIEECQAERAVQIGTTPIEPIWEGDYYSWKPTTPSDRLSDSKADLRAIQSLHVAVARPSLRGGIEHRCKACTSSPHPCQTWTSLQKLIERS